MGSREYSLIVFDLGGVVFDADFCRVFQAWADYSSVSFEAVKQRFSFDEQFEQFERGELSAKDYCSHINNLLQLELSYDEFASGWASIYGNSFPEVVTSIEQLSQSRRVIALTNTNELHLEVWPKRYGSELSSFNRMYSSCVLGLRKPDAASYHYVLDDCQTLATKALFVDDRYENIQAAAALGLDTIFLEDPRQLYLQLSERGLLV